MVEVKGEVKEITCIACPMGCRLKIEDTTEGYLIEGYTCKKGKEYGEQEMIDPRRIITTTVRVEGGMLNLLTVKTENAVPKGKIFDIMKEIDKVVVKAPVKVGDVIIEDLLGTGIRLLATRNMPKHS